jgi:hypothetical protein
VIQGIARDPVNTQPLMDRESAMAKTTYRIIALLGLLSSAACGSTPVEGSAWSDARDGTARTSSPFILEPTYSPGSIIVPVFFHVITAGTSLEEGNVPEAKLDEQIAVLNTAFSGGRGGASTPFYFVKAGTTRTLNASWFSGFSANQITTQERAAVTRLHTGGLKALNVYTVNAGTSWGIDPQWVHNDYLDDGIVLRFWDLPGLSVGNYSLGMTAVHEAGHWLGLAHPQRGGCNPVNDEVADTPQQAHDAAGCPATAPDTCPSDPGSDPIHNYMNTAYDACMTEFTPGQVARMSAMWGTYRDTEETRDGSAARMTYLHLVDEIGLPSGDAGWSLAGFAVLDGDETADLLWHRTALGGEPRIWKLTKAGVLTADSPLPYGPSGWKIAGTGDFNGDGLGDLVWWNTQDIGQSRIWLIGGDGSVREVQLPTGAPGWRINGVGDFDGDGVSDLLWRRSSDTGEARIWLLNSDTIPKRDTGLPPGEPGWRVNAVADFNADGVSDIVWRRSNETGEPRIWVIGAYGPGTPPTLLRDVGLSLPSGFSSTWRVAGARDFNLDGNADLVWFGNDGIGHTLIWLISGLKVVATQPLPESGPSWRINALGDLDGDGMSDIVWRNEANVGPSYIWKTGAFNGHCAMPECVAMDKKHLAVGPPFVPPPY